MTPTRGLRTAPALLALAATLPAAAQDAAPPAPAAPAASAPAPERKPRQLDRVEITGGRADDTQERRQSTAAKIVVGRDEIERYGDSNVGDLLKRLPGVTVQGRPGRGGAIRMRGLGSGYTQILIDGERAPPGATDAMSPEQIERIEVLRAPTAETGARAIAGTINIVTRDGFRRRLNDLRLAAGEEGRRLQPGATWSRSDSAGALAYSTSVSLNHSDVHNDSTSVTERRDLATDALQLRQVDTGIVRDRRDSVHASGRLQWRSESIGQLTLVPLLVHSRGTTVRDGRLVQDVGAEPVPYDSAHTDGSGSFLLTRLNTHWALPLAGGDRVESNLGVSRARNRTSGVRVETTGGATSRTLADEVLTVERSLTAGTKLSLTVAEEHTVVAGIEAEANRRSDGRSTLQDGAPLLVDFGEVLAARATRLAAYAQDEWNPSPTWAFQAGLRWEGIATRGDGENGTELRNRSSVWTPLLHAVWKPAPKSRDQVRVSLTRSYRSPTLGNLIARPSINTRYPVNDRNTATQPDRAGNPALKPELARGLDIAIEHYPPGGGILSANLFHRRITNYMRSVTSPQPETVSWSPVPRYVARVQNVGNAITQGIELEAKLRLSDLLPDAPAVDLRSNASLFRSRVAGVPGPDNRLDQQPGATANLGADWRIPGTPLTLGGTLNWTPGYDTRVSEAQSAFQGRKRVADAYALWVFNPGAQLRLSASNLDPRDHLTASTFDADGVRETTTTVGPTRLNLQVRLELKL